MKEELKEIVEQAISKIQLYTNGSVVIAVNFPDQQAVLCSFNDLYSDQLMHIIQALFDQLPEEWQNELIKRITETNIPISLN